MPVTSDLLHRFLEALRRAGVEADALDSTWTDALDPTSGERTIAIEIDGLTYVPAADDSIIVQRDHAGRREWASVYEGGVLGHWHRVDLGPDTAAWN